MKNPGKQQDERQPFEAKAEAALAGEEQACSEAQEEVGFFSFPAVPDIPHPGC